MIAQTYLPKLFRYRRPLEFKVLCILAFIFGGSTFLFSVIALFTFPATPEIFPFLRNEIFPAHYAEASMALVSIFLFILATLAFTGLIGMWHQRKFGFWLFFCSMILLVLLPFVAFRIPTIWIAGNLFPYTLIGVLLIILLGYNLKNLR